METSYTLTGTVKLNKQDLMEAISAYLANKKEPSQIKRIQYDQTLNTVLCDVYEQNGDKAVKMKFEKPKIRNNPGGWKKTYLGFKDALQEIVEEKRKEKQKQMPIEDLVKEIQYFFPKMERSRILQYLPDPRRKLGITVDKVKGLVIL